MDPHTRIRYVNLIIRNTLSSAILWQKSQYRLFAIHHILFKLIPLGVAMELPAGFEAHIYPRSSTYKNFGITQANSVAVVDNSYNGNDDQWMYPVIAARDTIIHKNDRICQFRIVRNQPEINFCEVQELNLRNILSLHLPYNHLLFFCDFYIFVLNFLII